MTMPSVQMLRSGGASKCHMRGMWKADLIGFRATSYKISIHTQPNKVLLVGVALEDSGSCAGLGVPQPQGAVSGS